MPIRVRTGRDYNYHFNVLHGQRNARLVARPMTPLVRLSEFFSAFAVVEPGYDLVHTFNAVPLAWRTPFVVSFEDFVPRFPEDRPHDRLQRWLVGRLLDQRCRRLIAISHYAMRQMAAQHRGAAYLAALREKATVVHPAVAIRHTAAKSLGHEIALAFVGADYFRKGGPALVRAHARLRAAGIPVTTTVVSSLRWSAGDYVGPPDRACGSAYRDELRASGVAVLGQVPNARVLELMQASHFLVLPTLHDTFGYVSLEAMAAGTPVIATATAAQPEVVVDGVNGFLLPLENDAIGRWAWLYRTSDRSYTERYRFEIDRLATGIFETVATAWERRRDYPRLSQGAIATVAQRFSKMQARARLEEIYAQSV